MLALARCGANRCTPEECRAEAVRGAGFFSLRSDACHDHAEKRLYGMDLAKI
jgi:hypothetical protein